MMFTIYQASVDSLFLLLRDELLLFKSSLTIFRCSDDELIRNIELLPGNRPNTHDLVVNKWIK